MEFRVELFFEQKRIGQANAERNPRANVPLLGIENFSMCSRRQSYVTHPNWQLGFSVLYFEPRSGHFQWVPILIGPQSRFIWRSICLQTA
jgi:hypothetical protein